MVEKRVIKTVSELLDKQSLAKETLTTGAIAPFVKRKGLGTTRPVPVLGFKYADDDDDETIGVEISEAGKIDFGKLTSIKEIEMDKIQQGSSVLWNGADAIVKRLSFKWDSRTVDVVLNVNGRIQTKSLRLEV